MVGPHWPDRAKRYSKSDTTVGPHFPRRSRQSNTQRAFLPFTGFRDIDAPNVWRPISLAMNGLKRCVNPSPEAFLRLRRRLAIHPWGRPIWNLT